jgi:hypothetical protein
MTTGAISNYLESKLVDHSLGTAEFTLPTPVYVALYTSAPTDADTGTEITGKAGYARQEAAFGAAVDGATDNDADIEFGPAGESWGTITHVGVRDAETGGNLLWWAALTTPKPVGDGDSFQVAAGDFDISLD